MKKISANLTVQKKMFPVIWFDYLGYEVLGGLFVPGGGAGKAILIAFPQVLAVFGYFVWKHFVLDLVDEVYDGGNYLLIRKAGEEVRVPLSEIINVNPSREGHRSFTGHKS